MYGGILNLKFSSIPIFEDHLYDQKYGYVKKLFIGFSQTNGSPFTGIQ